MAASQARVEGSLVIEDCSDRNRQTEASHPRPDASMRSEPKRHVMIWATRQVKPIRVS